MRVLPIALLLTTTVGCFSSPVDGSTPSPMHLPVPRDDAGTTDGGGTTPPVAPAPGTDAGAPATPGTPPPAPPVTPPPPVMPGELARVVIPSSGGDVVVASPGHPLDGLVIHVPADSYPDERTFVVTSAPSEGIAALTRSGRFTPTTPLVQVENGGGRAARLMTVRIPMRLEPEQKPTALLYEPGVEEADMMPIVELGPDHITVATLHFSTLVGGVSMTVPADYSGTVDSGFRPGRDDWQFPNYGSAAAPDGHCSGQTVSMLWHYLTRPGEALFGLHDDDAEGHEQITVLGIAGDHRTADVSAGQWLDDRRGYRLASAVQQDQDATGFAFAQMISSAASPFFRNDEQTFRDFYDAIATTGEPQYVLLQSSGSSEGHAILAYQVSNWRIRVADPNFPGDFTRSIVYDPTTRRFQPYQSGANALAAGTAYDGVVFVPSGRHSALFPFGAVADRWAQLESGTIGDDVFPAIDLVIRDDDGNEYTDGDTIHFRYPNWPQVTISERNGNLVSATIAYYGPHAGEPAPRFPDERYPSFDGLGTSATIGLARGCAETTDGTLSRTPEPRTALIGVFVADADGHYIDFRWITLTTEGRRHTCGDGEYPEGMDCCCDAMWDCSSLPDSAICQPLCL